MVDIRLRQGIHGRTGGGVMSALPPKADLLGRNEKGPLLTQSGLFGGLGWLPVTTLEVFARTAGAERVSRGPLERFVPKIN